MTAAPFDTLLVANRGEIAVRIMRSARAMGLRTVAVYSDADADAVHVAAADMAVRIGPAAPVESYLDVDRIIAAARSSGAGAVHPGYGFLSENAALARACAAAGLIFVGPPAEAIETMGDKAAAKAAMAAAGVPVVPGEVCEDQSDVALAAAADRVGYPVMIKAVAGGGGRGMRLVEEAKGFSEALHSARSEALAAFGDGTVLLERAIKNPRHVEIQVVADTHGAVLHLGERDCSVQRRHQKVIEEAPSPAVDAALRDRMGEVSVTAARALGYVGAGTFEYLLSDDGEFWFMEMNTRLQVEHPVTEAVTGLDLVALQLRVAMGAPLGLHQEDIRITGHAVEVRLCAEDPSAGFLPQSGEVARWLPPAEVRTDHALRDGATVPPQYDSMIAKLIAHGPDRDAALANLRQAMSRLVVLGLRTNQAFLSACLAHPRFMDGTATTGFVADHRAELLASPDGAEGRAARILAAVLHATDGSLAHGFGASLRLARNDRVMAPQVRPLGHGACAVDGRTYLVTRIGPGHDRVDEDGVTVTVHRVTVGRTHWLHLDGCAWDFEDRTFAPEMQHGDTVDGVIRAAMTGTVKSVAVAPGERVEAGQTLLILEAMKMEHAHRAPVTGKVAAVGVQPGAQVAARAVLAEITPDPEEGD